MSTSYGNNLNLYVDGGSHDPSISMKLEGFPADIEIDMDELAAFLARRAPGKGPHSTARKEADRPVFSSGIVNGRTTGGPIHAVIYNKDMRPSDYSYNDVPRPGHADYTAVMKYGKDVNISGGGHFSGRLTAPYCIAGGLCKQYLKTLGIEVLAHVYSVADVNDTPFDPVNVGRTEAEALKDKEIAVLDTGKAEMMLDAVARAKADGDSLGGIIECAVIGIDAGHGEHMFAGVEGRISSALYSIPAVKGVEFGAGFAAAAMRGSENNDPFSVKNGKIVTKTNNCGGILGGMTNGMPVICRAAIKPTPSIAKEQDSVSISSLEARKIRVGGRHDPCIVFRAVAAVEAAVAVAITDILLDKAPKSAEVTDLSLLREQIDRCDRKIVETFCERMDITLGVAEYKKQRGLPVLDSAREKQLLDKIEKLAGDELGGYAHVLYSTLLSVSRARQHKMLGGCGSEAKKLSAALEATKDTPFPTEATVCVQGVSGAFSEAAARKMVAEPKLTFKPSFLSVVEAVESGECRYGVLPIENSTAGAVTGIYSLLLKHPVYIVRSAYVGVEHNLLAPKGTDISDIKEVYSHEQAINQCSAFLKTLGNVKLTYCPNTALAARMVAESGRGDVAALSSLSCAEIYGLDVLKESVQDNSGNRTRFVCISKEPEIYENSVITDVIASTKNEPGALASLLTRIYTFDINIKKLESMPLADGASGFYLSLEEPADSPALGEALTSVEEYGTVFRWLGTYPEALC
ncbi:MAG: chorismate synthase [Clostridia bacterium]|nr:chorismate synthase [Clostridia bacterium]